MKMHNTYSYGQLFCFSGLDGETSRMKDFVAMMLDEPITLRFHFETTVTLHIPLKDEAVFHAVTGDMLDGEDFFVAFVDKDTIIGKAPVKPIVLTEKESERVQMGDVEAIKAEFGGEFFLKMQEENGQYYFAFSYGKQAELWSDEAMSALRQSRYAYFENKPACKEEKYKKLYYKCLAIQKKTCIRPKG